MKPIFFLLVLLLTVTFASAQMPPGGGKGGAPNMGHVYGRVVDSTGHGIGAATVVLLVNKFDTVAKKNKSVLFKGLSTSSNGDFSLEDLPMFGPLTLKISATGYKPYQTVVTFQMRMPAGGGAPGASGDPAKATILAEDVAGRRRRRGPGSGFLLW